MPLVIFHSRSDRKDNISYSKGGGGENKVTNDQDQEVLQVTTKQRRQRTEEEYSPTPPCVGGLGCSSGMNQYSLSCHFKKSFSLDGERYNLPLQDATSGVLPLVFGMLELDMGKA
ncbi:MAG: hypothetical protein ACPGQT_01985 [Rhodothermales bacterium]